MPLLLDIPYQDKEKAKHLGARWNDELNLWVVEQRDDYVKFAKWMKMEYEFTNIICDEIYIIEKIILCPYCKEKTKLVTIGADNLISIKKHKIKSNIYYTRKTYERMVFFSYIEKLPKYIFDFLQETYNFYEEYDNEYNYSFFANHCMVCEKTLQSEGDLVNSLNKTPYFYFFYPCTKIKEITFYKCNLDYDFITSGSYSWDDALDFFEPQYKQIEI